MGDFHQHGLITTLHQLNTRPLDLLESDLMEFRKTRPLGLVLPSLYSELEQPALTNIVDELCQVPYLDQIVIGIDKADQQQYRHALEFFSRLPQKPNVLWNDGPRLRRIDDLLKEHKLAPEEAGKGRNVWYMFGYVLASGKAQSVALHDCDITTYHRSMLARLLYPVANTSLSYRFCKGYYARVANQTMNGRVCRLLVTPLLRALKKVVGPNDYLDFLDSFRYALAGEFAMQRDVLEDVRIPSDWGLEMGILSEMHRNYATGQICQVDIATTYDHKHQDMSEHDRSKGLSKMSSDIAKSLFRKMATQGEVFSTERIRTIKATYYRIALDLIESHASDAAINGITYDRHNEGLAVELFAENIMSAGNEFLDKAMDTPFMPSWKRVISAVPDILNQLLEAVEADTQEFGTNAVLVPSMHPRALRLRGRISLHLEKIYPDHDLDSLADRVLKASELNQHAPVRLDEVKRWDQSDQLVITYGDSIQTPNEAPLQTLHRFLLKELKGAINGVHILPFTPFSSDDGFSVIDYKTVNPNLGDWSDLEAMSKDFTIMADLVLNHCSSKSRWFQNYLKGIPPGAGFFIEAHPDDDLSDVVRPRAHPLLTPFETNNGTKHLWCTFSEDQLDLDFRNPDVLCAFIDIIKDYIKHGIRFFRLDAVAFLWKEPGTDCVHRPETHEVIKLLRLLIENLRSDAVVITETNVPNRENLSYFGNDNEAHLIYNFSLPPLLLNTMLTGDCGHLKAWMMSMPPARFGRAYLNFIASHDGIGLRPTEGLLSEHELNQLLQTLTRFGGTISTGACPMEKRNPTKQISLFTAPCKGLSEATPMHINKTDLFAPIPL